MEALNMDSNKAAAQANLSHASAKRHGRTTDIKHNVDLQVLKRIRKHLLPKDFQISESLLQEIQAGF